MAVLCVRLPPPYLLILLILPLPLHRKLSALIHSSHHDRESVVQVHEVARVSELGEVSRRAERVPLVFGELEPLEHVFDHSITTLRGGEDGRTCAVGHVNGWLEGRLEVLQNVNQACDADRLGKVELCCKRRG